MPRTKKTSRLQFLTWFYQNADFGPADGEVRDILKKFYESEVGPLPRGYEREECEED